MPIFFVNGVLAREFLFPFVLCPAFRQGRQGTNPPYIREGDGVREDRANRPQPPIREKR